MPSKRNAVDDRVIEQLENERALIDKTLDRLRAAQVEATKKKARAATTKRNATVAAAPAEKAGG